jgi:hypothetical protein
MTPEEITKTKARIAKLLNMTVENGCSEDEATNAMRMAAGLATKIGIELDAVRPAGAPKPKIVEKRKYTVMKVYECFCSEAAAVLYGVDCYAPNYGKNGYWFLGREENVELAEQTMIWLVQQVEQLYKQSLPRGLSKRDRANFRGSFKDACGGRLYQRALLLMREMETQDATAQASTGSSALVVAGYFETLRNEIKEYEDEKYWAPMRAAEAKRQEERTAKLALMTEPERVKFLEDEEKQRGKSAAKPYKAPRHRNPKRGSGTAAGWEAGGRVQLRKEIG